MSKITKEFVIQVLASIYLPEKNQSIVDAGMVSSIIIKDGSVGFALEMRDMEKEKAENIRKQCEQALTKIDGVKKVTVVLTAETKKSADVDKKNVPSPPSPSPIAGIKNVIIVGSGKGGVGKSTIAANLATTFALLGYRTGLVDADIYGPSVARMMNISKHDPQVKNNQIVPPENHGVKCMSMGFLLDENAPVVWRGPMISKALYQLLRGATWGELDFLVIDLPPGTGDIHLSIAQNFNVRGAVAVTTSQDIAILDVKKFINMLGKVNIPILGVIENMSFFEDPDSGKKHYIFGSGGAKNLADAIGAPLLGQIPLDSRVTETSDSGKPISIAAPDHIISKTFKNICTTITENLTTFKKTEHS